MSSWLTHPGDLLLRINLIILRGRGEVQVALAISSSYAHAVYLVLAGATFQTEKENKQNARLIIHALIIQKRGRCLKIETWRVLHPLNLSYEKKCETTRNLTKLYFTETNVIKRNEILPFLPSSQGWRWWMFERDILDACCSRAHHDATKRLNASGVARKAYVTTRHEYVSVNNPVARLLPRYRFSAANKVYARKRTRLAAALLISTAISLLMKLAGDTVFLNVVARYDG